MSSSHCGSSVVNSGADFQVNGNESREMEQDDKYYLQEGIRELLARLRGTRARTWAYARNRQLGSVVSVDASKRQLKSNKISRSNIPVRGHCRSHSEGHFSLDLGLSMGHFDIEPHEDIVSNPAGSEKSRTPIQELPEALSTKDAVGSESDEICQKCLPIISELEDELQKLRSELEAATVERDKYKLQQNRIRFRQPALTGTVQKEPLDFVRTRSATDRGSVHHHPLSVMLSQNIMRSDSVISEDEGIGSMLSVSESSSLHPKSQQPTNILPQYRTPSDISSIDEVPSDNEPSIGQNYPYDSVKKPFVVQEALEMPSSLRFIGPVQVLRITHAGIKYCNDKLGLCINIPQGAIIKGLELHLEVGMSLYGPFEYPAGTSPISPILMLCPQENVTLQKPIEVTLPHCIDQASQADVKALGIRIVKADHSQHLAVCTMLEDQVRFSFMDMDEAETDIRFSQDGDAKEYVTFSLSHFCFISLRSATSSEAARRKGFCIIPLQPIRFPPACNGITYHLPITYYMSPWLEALKEQYLKEGYQLLKKNAIAKFTLKSLDGATIQGEIINRETIRDNWVVYFEREKGNGIQIISAALVDVWRIDIDELLDDIENLQYPPCFCLNAFPSIENPRPVVVHVTLKTPEDREIDMNLLLSCAAHPVLSSSDSSPAQSSSITTLTNQLHLQELKERTWDARSQWRPLAGALGVTYATTEGIEQNCKNEGERLEKTLAEWICSGNATMHKLLEALDNRTVMRGDISRQLRSLKGKDRRQLGLCESDCPVCFN